MLPKDEHCSPAKVFLRRPLRANWFWKNQNDRYFFPVIQWVADSRRCVRGLGGCESCNCWRFLCMRLGLGLPDPVRPSSVLTERFFHQAMGLVSVGGESRQDFWRKVLPGCRKSRRLSLLKIIALELNETCFFDHHTRGACGQRPSASSTTAHVSLSALSEFGVTGLAECI